MIDRMVWVWWISSRTVRQALPGQQKNGQPMESWVTHCYRHVGRWLQGWWTSTILLNMTETTNHTNDEQWPIQKINRQSLFCNVGWHTAFSECFTPVNTCTPVLLAPQTIRITRRFSYVNTWQKTYSGIQLVDELNLHVNLVFKHLLLIHDPVTILS